ncbi:MAG: hypothetical protein ACM3JH_06560 [Acidithiobacillales bacterium]
MPRAPEGPRVEKEDPKEWNPRCPKCQVELERMMELSRSVYDDMDHGAALYRLPLPPCTHPDAPPGPEGPKNAA